jgi:hypothetical protein
MSYTNTDSKLVHTLAAEMSKAFTRSERTNGDKYVFLANGSPQWMTDAVHKAHGDTMPDDFIYSFCEKGADAIAESDEDSDLDTLREAIDDIEPPCYTNEQMKWFATNWEYCDQAIEEGIWQTGGKSTIADLVAIGMQTHIREVAYALLDALIEEADSR